MAYIALPTKNPGDVLTSTLWDTYLQGNADNGFARMLADTTLGIAAASFDFASIPQTFAHLRLVAYLRCDDVSTAIAPGVRFNGDTAANYDFQRIYGQAAVAVESEGIASTSAQTGVVPAASAPANVFAVVTFDIVHYTGAANQKALAGSFASKSANSTGNVQAGAFGGFWRNAAAINRLTLIDTSGGNFVAGSRATLYGLPQ